MLQDLFKCKHFQTSPETKYLAYQQNELNEHFIPKKQGAQLTGIFMNVKYPTVDYSMPVKKTIKALITDQQTYAVYEEQHCFYQG